MTPLRRFVDDLQCILQKVAESTGIVDPVAIDLDVYLNPVLKRAIRGPVLPLSGVLIRDWDPDYRKYWPGVRFGVRLYTLDGVDFARVSANVSDSAAGSYDFFVVGLFGANGFVVGRVLGASGVPVHHPVDALQFDEDGFDTPETSSTQDDGFPVRAVVDLGDYFCKMRHAVLWF